MDNIYTKARYSVRYGWHLKEETMPICKTCGHNCHCSNGGVCQSGQCNCSSCQHQSYEAYNA